MWASQLRSAPPVVVLAPSHTQCSQLVRVLQWLTIRTCNEHPAVDISSYDAAVQVGVCVVWYAAVHGHERTAVQQHCTAVQPPSTCMLLSSLREYSNANASAWHHTQGRGTGLSLPRGAGGKGNEESVWIPPTPTPTPVLVCALAHVLCDHAPCTYQMPVRRLQRRFEWCRSEQQQTCEFRREVAVLGRVG